MMYCKCKGRNVAEADLEMFKDWALTCAIHGVSRATVNQYAATVRQYLTYVGNITADDVLCRLPSVLDDIKRTAVQSEPVQAPPVTLAKFNLLTKKSKTILRFQISLGCRFATLRRIREEDVLVMKDGTLNVYMFELKYVPEASSRVGKIFCTCVDLNHGAQECLVHGHRPRFPIDVDLYCFELQRANLTPHSAKVSANCCAKRLIETYDFSPNLGMLYHNQGWTYSQKSEQKASLPMFNRYNQSWDTMPSLQILDAHFAVLIGMWKPKNPEALVEIRSEKVKDLEFER